jgi:4-hydroxythreonine-4-phosphate dehydrogenase
VLTSIPDKPRIALTVGDPSGIGPEIVGKAMADPRVLAACEPVLYAPAGERRYLPGVLTAEAGAASYEVIGVAVKDALAGRVDGIATAPINKHAWSLAGLHWKGHTDLLAHLTGAPRVAMLFWSEPLKVVLATVHIPLADVSAVLTREVLEDVIELTASELPSMGLPLPRLALAGLNPHAGEDGVIGREEQDVLRPALEGARARGIRIDGPFPADTLFVRASRGEFDVVIACYHDQGLIPVKLLAFGRAVNVTLGLPIVRTSVDHGTAFDIAGTGMADGSSMVEAVLLAARLAATRRRAVGESVRTAPGIHG